MADSRIDIRFVVHAEELKQGATKALEGLTAKTINENNKQVAHAQKSAKANYDAHVKLFADIVKADAQMFAKRVKLSEASDAKTTALLVKQGREAEREAKKKADAEIREAERAAKHAEQLRANQIKAHAQAFAKRVSLSEIQDSKKGVIPSLDGIMSERLAVQSRVGKLSFKELDKEYRSKLTLVKDMERQLSLTTDAEGRKRIATNIKNLKHETSLIGAEYKKRPEVMRRGQGASLGILGTGRNLISQSGVPVLSTLAGGPVAAAVVVAATFKKLYDVGLENAKIQDDLRAGFAATGKSGYELSKSVEAASRSAETLGDRYLIDDNIVEQFTATYLKFGGSSDNIAKKQELIIGLSERTGMSFDDAARALAKSTDPDIALELKRQGIVMGDAATEGERLAIVAKAVEGNLKGLADKANSEAGKVEKFKLGMDNLMDSLGEFAFNFGAPVVDVLNDITGALNKLFTTVEERSGSAARALVTAQMTVDEARAAGRKAAIEAGDDAKAYEERFVGELKNKNLEVAISASDKKVQELSKNTALSLKKQGKKTAEEVIAVMKSQNYFIDANVIKGVNEAFAKAKDKPKPTGTKSSTENPQKKLYDEQKKEWDALLRFQQDLEDIYREQEIQSEEEANLHKLEIEQAFIVKKLKLAEKANNIQDITELTRLQTLVNMRIDILRNAINEVDTLIPPDIQNGIIPVGLTNEDGETDFSGIKTPDESKAKLVETPDYVKDLANNAKSAFESLLFDPLDAMISKTTNGVDKFFMNITSQLLKLASSKLLEGIFGGLLAILNPASGLGFLGGFLKVFGIKFADGGIVPGVDTGKDTVPAVLRPGEFVLTRNAARAIGYDNLDGINSLARNPSLGLSGGLPHGGQDKQSIKIGGIIRRGDRPIGKRQDETDLGTDGSLRIGSLANAINRSNYNANFAVNNNGQLISEIRALRQVVAQQQTIVMDMYGVHLGTLRSRNAKNIGVIA